MMVFVKSRNYGERYGSTSSIFLLKLSIFVDSDYFFMGLGMFEGFGQKTCIAIQDGVHFLNGTH